MKKRAVIIFLFVFILLFSLINASATEFLQGSCKKSNTDWDENEYPRTSEEKSSWNFKRNSLTRNWSGESIYEVVYRYTLIIPYSGKGIGSCIQSKKETVTCAESFCTTCTEEKRTCSNYGEDDYNYNTCYSEMLSHSLTYPFEFSAPGDKFLLTFCNQWNKDCTINEYTSENGKIHYKDVSYSSVSKNSYYSARRDSCTASCTVLEESGEENYCSDVNECEKCVCLDFLEFNGTAISGNCHAEPDFSMDGQSCVISDEQGGICSSGKCIPLENTPPKIQGALKAIYINKADNIFSLIDENGTGKIKINSLKYDKPIISDKETKISDLKIQIGSNKITSPGSVNFNSADIGLNFEELPKQDSFYLGVSDDGSTSEDSGKGEEKTSKLQTQVYWCPEELKLKGAYDVRVSAKADIWKAIFRIYWKDELMFDRMSKELSADLKFNEDSYPSGTFTIHIVNKIRDGLGASRPTLEAGRSRGIKEIQRKLEKELDIKITEELAKWGCAEGQWKEHDFDETGKNPDVEEVCERYESEMFDYEFTYDFDTQKLILLGNIGDIKKRLEIDFSVEKFPKLLKIVSGDVPDVVDEEKTPDTKVKIAESEYNLGGVLWVSTIKESGYLENDWHNREENGMLKPSEVVEKVGNCIEFKKPETVILDTLKNTISTESLESYYYTQEPFFQSMEGDAIKISLDVNLSHLIKKIFYYNESEYENENNLELYKYKDNEIDGICDVAVVSENNFIFNASGGDFKTNDAEVIIPENLVIGNNALNIKKVIVSNCFEGNSVYTNQKKINAEDIIDEIKNWKDGIVGVELVIDKIKIWRNLN